MLHVALADIVCARKLLANVSLFRFGLHNFHDIFLVALISISIPLPAKYLMEGRGVKIAALGFLWHVANLLTCCEMPGSC